MSLPSCHHCRVVVAATWILTAIGLTALCQATPPPEQPAHQGSPQVPRQLAQPQRLDSMTLLNSPYVAKMLDLKADQQDAVEFIQQEIEAAATKARQQASERLAPMLQRTLTSEQQTRLRQIRVRAQGIASLVIDSDVQKALRLSEGQQRRLGRLQTTFVQQLEEQFQAVQAGRADQLMNLGHQLRIAMDQREHKMLDLLSDGQRQQWQELQGSEE